MLASLRNLRALAALQHGYFSAAQAKRCGFSDKLHSYHCRAGNWRKVQRGLFRLPEFPDSQEANFAFWLLWSRNKSEQPQGVISHQSALAAHDLGLYDPNAVHLTVPLSFRKPPPAGCVLHKASLNLSAIETRRGILVTRLTRTLADLRPGLVQTGTWEEILRRALEQRQLTPAEAEELGFVSVREDSTLPRRADQTEETPPPASGAEADPAATSLTQSELAMAAEPSSAWLSSSAAESKSSENFTSDSPSPLPMNERIFQMICRRTRFRPPLRQRSQAGFTLVELLVVVAIISILAGLLLPALEKSLAAARTLDCASNCRQLFLGVEGYADSLSDWLPAGGDGGQWRREVLPYVDENAAQKTAGYTNYSTFFYLRKSVPVFVCKAMPAKMDSSVTGLGWNYTYLGYSDDPSTPPARIQRQAIPKPSQTIMLGDTSDFYIAGPWQAFHLYTPGNTIGPGYRHNQGINLAYADGHAAWHARVFLMNNSWLYRRDK